LGKSLKRAEQSRDWPNRQRDLAVLHTLIPPTSLLFLFSLFSVVSWQEAVGLIISAFVVRLVFTLIPDYFAMWVIGTLAIYPLMVSVVMTGWRL
jgi:hypothetical protein